MRTGILATLTAMAFAVVLSIFDVRQVREALVVSALGAACLISGFALGRERIPILVPAGGTFLLIALLAVVSHFLGLTQGTEALYLFGILVLLTLTHIVLYSHSLLVFLVRRFALMLVTLVGITLVTFVIIRAAPGDPATVAVGAGGAGAGGVNPAQMARNIQKSQRELLGISQKYAFRSVPKDPNGDTVQLIFDWGDGSEQSRSPYGPSDVPMEVEHSFENEGTYEVRCQTADRSGARSPWSPVAVIEIREKNQPPSVPDLTGPAEVGLRDKPKFSALSSDPERGSITYLFDWGTEDIGKATPPAGVAGAAEYQWPATGSYLVRVAAIDEKGAFSGWSKPVQVIVREPGNPLMQPGPLDVPSVWILNREIVARARIPAGSPDCAVEFEFGEKAERTKFTSPVAAAGAWVEARTTLAKFPDNDRKELRIRARTVSGNRTSSWRAARIQITESNLPPDTPETPTGPSKGRVTRPVWLQYVTWLGRCVTLDFGRSSKHHGYIVDLRSRETKLKEGKKPGDYDYWGVLWPRIKNTMSLEIWSFLLIYLIAVPIGIYSSTHHKSTLDRTITFVLFVLYSLPSFWVGSMLIVLVTPVPEVAFIGISCREPGKHAASPLLQSAVVYIVLCLSLAALAFRLLRKGGLPTGLSMLAAIVTAPFAFWLLAKWGLKVRPWIWFAVTLVSLLAHVFVEPTAGRRTLAIRSLMVTGLGLLAALLLHLVAGVHFFWHALLPVICLTYGGLAALSRYARSGMLEVVRQDYIRTARAKGLSERVVIFKHALRNGMIPILTLLANLLPYMIGGAIIIEFIFSIDGMGNLAYTAINDRDYNVVMAVTTISAVMTLLGILISDILYVLVDPRISFESLEA